MHELEGAWRPGCRRQLIGLTLFLWFAMVVTGSTWVVSRLLGEVLPVRAVDGLAILFAALAICLPNAALAMAVRGRPGWQGLGALATALLICGGYVVLDAAVGLLLPPGDGLLSLRRIYGATGLRLAVLMPFALLSAWMAPRVAGAGTGQGLRQWLGLARGRWGTALLGVAIAALLTVAWPVTGALGDSLTSLALGALVFAIVIPQIAIFWGVTFHLLTAASASTRRGVGAAIVIYSLTVLGELLPGGGSGGLANGLLLLSLAFLLAEMRIRGGGIISLLPLVFLCVAAPALFVDPRDSMATGIPELQHLVSYVATAGGAIVTGGGLWLARRIKVSRLKKEEPQPNRQALILVAALGWAVWIGIYLRVGEPGFFNDGFLIVLEEQADLSPAFGIVEREERLTYVYRTLVETADTTQSAIRAELDDLGVPYRSHYVINMVRVEGRRWLMGRFEALPGVAEVVLNPNVRRYPRRIPLPYEDAGPMVVGVQTNLAVIGADVAWEQGVDGAGIVVGGQDTGYDWEHPALQGSYRGWDGEQGNHDYNWHDAWDQNPAPFDDGSHGTHTMGTVAGDAGTGSRIGVAPGAQWIGCRNMRRGFGNPGSYLECMEFLFAPFPLGGDALSDGDVRLGAQVTNNSWGCPPMEGCFPDTLRAGVEALRAAGIVTVVSAGNDGPACGTATTPPANYAASFSVGATTDGTRVAGFSSRGPIDGLIKPDIAAPGARVRSSVPGGGYAYASGTSMAAPHVTGAVALVWSADSDLLGDPARTEALLCATSLPRAVYQACDVQAAPKGPFAALMDPPPCACGDVTGVPNNVYGCGVVDVGAAVTMVLGE